MPNLHRTLYVASTESHARAIANDLGIKPPYRFMSEDGAEMVTWPSGALQGMRFNLIIISESVHRDAYHASEGRRRDLERWLKEMVYCRLAPGGRLVTV